MPAGTPAVRLARLALSVATALLIAGFSGLHEMSRAWQEVPGQGEPAIRVVHGIVDAGPLDVYVDGAVALIGIVFADTSGDLSLRPGEHQFAVVPTGENLDDAIAQGNIELGGEARYYTTLLGTSESASVGLFEIDDRPLDAGRARFRVIGGVIDAGEIVPIFAGSDALSEPLQFGDASEYASIDAGLYDFDILGVVSGGSLLSLPQTELAEGTTTDIVLVGQVGEGSLQALTVLNSVEVARVLGRTAKIQEGSCAAPGDIIADLGIVNEGQGQIVGAPQTAQVQQGYGVAAIPFASLIGSVHTVTVANDAAAGGDVVACGGIGGALTDTGALVIALGDLAGGAPGGIAVLAPALEDPETTGVSIFVTASNTATNRAATPEAME
ncbi:MAG: DUF4397 domain-containing protein [Chloroflexota bacterium]|nr:DUF4397 domain-containing protein [Chloroflexota bacterium]